MQREWNWETPPPTRGKYETLTPVYTKRGVAWVQEIYLWTGRVWNDERYPATDIKAWRDVSAWRPAWSQTTRIFMEEDENVRERPVIDRRRYAAEDLD